MTKEAQITMLREQVHDLVLERLTELVTEAMKNNSEFHSFKLETGSYPKFYDCEGYYTGDFVESIEWFVMNYAKGVNINGTLHRKDLLK